MLLRDRTLAHCWEVLHPSAGDQSDYDHDHDDHQNDVNQGSTDVKRESEEPQYQQNNRNSPKHGGKYTFHCVALARLLFWAMQGLRGVSRVKGCVVEVRTHPNCSRQAEEGSTAFVPGAYRATSCRRRIYNYRDAFDSDLCQVQV